MSLKMAKMVNLDGYVYFTTIKKNKNSFENFKNCMVFKVPPA